MKPFNWLALGTGVLIFLVGISVVVAYVLGADISDHRVGTSVVLIGCGGIIVGATADDK